MHRALQISEIIYMIVQCLSRPPDCIHVNACYRPIRYYTNHEDETKGRALLSLSLTSKFFLEPCLDALWRCMLSARPLFYNIVPPEKRARADERSRQAYHEVMGLARFLENADWTRFQYYASRIQGLCVHLDDLDTIFSHALCSWQCSARANRLLPNLQYLHWADYRNTSLSCLNLLSGPNVTFLTLSLIDWQEDCHESLYTTLLPLREASPFLQDVGIVDYRKAPRIGFHWQLASMSSALLNITSAEFTYPPSGDILIYLSKLPRLRTLKGELYRKDSFIMADSTPLDFPSLQHLHWTVHSPSEAGTLLLRLRPSDRTRDFKTVAFLCDSYINTTELKFFLDILLSTCSMQSLVTLTLDFDSEESEAISIPRLPSTDLHRLFQYSHIEALRLGGLPVELDDALVAAVATTWLHLLVLHLHASMPWTCSVTPAGLLPLARQCRQLKDLAVDVGSWPRPILPSLHESVVIGGRHDQLYIYVLHSVVEQSESREDGVQTAAKLQLLWTIFPNAGNIRYNHLPVRRCRQDQHYPAFT